MRIFVELERAVYRLELYHEVTCLFLQVLFIFIFPNTNVRREISRLVYKSDSKKVNLIRV